MLLQQCRSGDSPIEPCTVRHRRSNVAVDGVGGDLWRSGTGMRVQTQEGGLKGVVWVRCRHAGVVMESQGVFKFV